MQQLRPSFMPLSLPWAPPQQSSSWTPWSGGVELIVPCQLLQLDGARSLHTYGLGGRLRHHQPHPTSVTSTLLDPLRLPTFPPSLLVIVLCCLSPQWATRLPTPFYHNDVLVTPDLVQHRSTLHSTPSCLTHHYPTCCHVCRCHRFLHYLASPLRSPQRQHPLQAVGQLSNHLP
jgi:hypothetical protein